MANVYPPVGFHFKVEFQFGGGQETDMFFQSVAGLNYQLQTDTLKEGGELRFEHVIPVRAKCSDLVLKRGYLKPKDSKISQWCQDAFQNFIFTPIDVVVKLLDEKHEPLMIWNVHHAWPKNWKTSDFNAERGELVIETFELAYNFFTFK